MAKLKIKAPNGKTLLIDVTGHNPSEYDDLATAAMQDYTSSPNYIPAMADDIRNEAGLESDPLGVVTGPAKIAGKMTAAGGAGAADLVSGNGLDTAAGNVQNSENDKPLTTTAAKVGEKVGEQFSPAQIAIQSGLGSAVEASGIGPWLTSTLKGWASGAARAAVGVVKKVADAIGVKNLDEVGQFLLSPVKLGAESFDPIVTATSSSEEMLDQANKIKAAAAQQLGSSAKAADAAIAEQANAPMAVNDAKVMVDIPALQGKIKALRDSVVLKRLGSAVINQYDNALKDLADVIQKSLQGDAKTVFSDLSDAKTSLGDLVYKHGTPLDSKAALNDVYHAVSETLNDAAQRAGGDVSTNYAQANAVYNKAATVADALEGKIARAEGKSFWNDPAALVAALKASSVTGPAAVVAAPAAFLATKGAEAYGPQAVAQGLNASAPLLGSALRSAVRAVPMVGNTIADALGGQ